MAARHSRARAQAWLTQMWKPAYHRRYRIIQGVGPGANSGGRGATAHLEFRAAWNDTHMMWQKLSVGRLMA